MFIYINVYGSIIYDCKIKYLDNIIMSENNNEQESAAGPEQSGNAAEVNEVIIDLGQKDDIEEETKEDISVQQPAQVQPFIFDPRDLTHLQFIHTYVPIIERWVIEDMVVEFIPEYNNLRAGDPVDRYIQYAIALRLGVVPREDTLGSYHDVPEDRRARIDHYVNTQVDRAWRMSLAARRGAASRQERIRENRREGQQRRRERERQEIIRQREEERERLKQRSKHAKEHQRIRKRNELQDNIEKATSYKINTGLGDDSVKVMDYLTLEEQSIKEILKDKDNIVFQSDQPPYNATVTTKEMITNLLFNPDYLEHTKYKCLKKYEYYHFTDINILAYSSAERPDLKFINTRSIGLIGGLFLRSQLQGILETINHSSNPSRHYVYHIHNGENSKISIKPIISATNVSWEVKPPTWTNQELGEWRVGLTEASRRPGNMVSSDHCADDESDNFLVTIASVKNKDKKKRKRELSSDGAKKSKKQKAGRRKTKRNKHKNKKKTRRKRKKKKTKKRR